MVSYRRQCHCKRDIGQGERGAGAVTFQIFYFINLDLKFAPQTNDAIWALQAAFNHTKFPRKAVLLCFIRDDDDIYQKGASSYYDNVSLSTSRSPSIARYLLDEELAKSLECSDDLKACDNDNNQLGL